MQFEKSPSLYPVMINLPTVTPPLSSIVASIFWNPLTFLNIILNEFLFLSAKTSVESFKITEYFFNISVVILVRDALSVGEGTPGINKLVIENPSGTSK